MSSTSVKSKGVSLLSKTSKMPGFSFSISAFECVTGSKLAEVPGSVCEDCYARKGFYHMPVVKNALSERLLALQASNFVDIMVMELEKKNEPHFRWFDSGDVLEVSHCLKIIAVCERTPHIKHWAPTKEPKLWAKAFKMHPQPKNLIVRLSAPMKDDVVKPTWTKHTSSVQSKEGSVKGRICPAPQQNNTCGDCRACWDKRVPNIVYKEH